MFCLTGFRSRVEYKLDKGEDEYLVGDWNEDKKTNIAGSSVKDCSSKYEVSRITSLYSTRNSNNFEFSWYLNN